MNFAFGWFRACFPIDLLYVEVIDPINHGCASPKGDEVGLKISGEAKVGLNFGFLRGDNLERRRGGVGWREESEFRFAVWAREGAEGCGVGIGDERIGAKY